VGLFCLWLTDRTSCLKSRDVRFESSNTNGVGLLFVGHNDQNDQTTRGIGLIQYWTRTFACSRQGTSVDLMNKRTKKTRQETMRS